MIIALLFLGGLFSAVFGDNEEEEKFEEDEKFEEEMKYWNFENFEETRKLPYIRCNDDNFPDLDIFFFNYYINEAVEAIREMVRDKIVEVDDFGNEAAKLLNDEQRKFADKMVSAFNTTLKDAALKAKYQERPRKRVLPGVEKIGILPGIEKAKCFFNWIGKRMGFELLSHIFRACVLAKTNEKMPTWTLYLEIFQKISKAENIFDFYVETLIQNEAFVTKLVSVIEKLICPVGRLQKFHPGKSGFKSGFDDFDVVRYWFREDLTEYLMPIKSNISKIIQIIVQSLPDICKDGVEF